MKDVKRSHGNTAENDVVRVLPRAFSPVAYGVRNRRSPCASTRSRCPPARFGRNESLVGRRIVARRRRGRAPTRAPEFAGGTLDIVRGSHMRTATAERRTAVLPRAKRSGSVTRRDCPLRRTSYLETIVVIAALHASRSIGRSSAIRLSDFRLSLVPCTPPSISITRHRA